MQPGPGEELVVINYTPEQQRRAGYWTIVFIISTLVSIGLASEALDYTDVLPEKNDVLYGILAYLGIVTGVGGAVFNQEIWRTGKRQYIADTIPN